MRTITSLHDIFSWNITAEGNSLPTTNPPCLFLADVDNTLLSGYSRYLDTVEALFGKNILDGLPPIRDEFVRGAYLGKCLHELLRLYLVYVVGKKEVLEIQSRDGFELYLKTMFCPGTEILWHTLLYDPQSAMHAQMQYFMRRYTFLVLELVKKELVHEEYAKKKYIMELPLHILHEAQQVGCVCALMSANPVDYVETVAYGYGLDADVEYLFGDEHMGLGGKEVIIQTLQYEIMGEGGMVDCCVFTMGDNLMGDIGILTYVEARRRVGIYVHPRNMPVSQDDRQYIQFLEKRGIEVYLMYHDHEL